MLSRMPAKWGALRPYFLLGIGGTILLTSIFAAMPYAADLLNWQYADYLTRDCSLEYAGGQLDRRARALCAVAKSPPRLGVAVPIGAIVVALNWLRPASVEPGSRYLHPLMALWFLDRELAHHPLAWRKVYRASLAMLPLCLIGLWWLLGSTPDLPGDDPLSAAIARHAGAEIIGGRFDAVSWSRRMSFSSCFITRRGSSPSPWLAIGVCRGRSRRCRWRNDPSHGGVRSSVSCCSALRSC